MLKILRHQELLTKRSIPVLEVTPELRRFAAEMFAKMQLSQGVGLSAPQVGRYICFIVFDCVNHSMNAMDSGYMFNPEIIESSAECNVDKEGCLSFPGEYCDVARADKITVKYIDLSNKEVVRSYKGLAARIIQHEIDHLNGLTMYDRELENGRST